MKQYIVKGTYEGKSINESVSASSKKQAKLKAGFNSGFGGHNMVSFLKSRKVKAREK